MTPTARTTLATQPDLFGGPETPVDKADAAILRALTDPQPDLFGPVRLPDIPTPLEPTVCRTEIYCCIDVDSRGICTRYHEDLEEAGPFFQGKEFSDPGLLGALGCPAKSTRFVIPNFYRCPACMEAAMQDRATRTRFTRP